MNKKDMLKQLEEFIESSPLDSSFESRGPQNNAVVSAMNLLADLKGYKVQYCKKSVRPVKEQI